jgi:hypothetical protein
VYYRAITEDDRQLRNSGINENSKFTKDLERSSKEKWSDFMTPMNTHWRNFVPQAKRLLAEHGPRDDLQAILSALKEGPQTRWITDLLPQVKRVLSQGKSEIVLVLSFCPLSDQMNDLDDPNSRTLKVATGFEMPGGPPVVLLNIRKNCIRERMERDGKVTESCLTMCAEEARASLEHLNFELYILSTILVIKISSVVAFSDI